MNRFRGFLVPRPDWIKGLYLFGTLGLHRLLMKTLKFHKISKFSKNFKILKLNFLFLNKISKFLKSHKISKFQKLKKKSKFS